LRVGVHLGNGTVEEIIRRSILADKLRFDVVVLADHLVYPPSSAPAYDAWAVLSVVAAKTRKVHFSALVTDPFRRHPALLAQTLCTLDSLSKGRVFLMIGAGEPMSIVPIGVAFEKPISRLEEFVESLKLLLGSSPARPVTFNGRFFKLKDAFLQVKPFQIPRPPIYLAAGGSRGKRVAAIHGDGFVNHCDTAEGYGKSVDQLTAYLRDSKKDPAQFDFALCQRTALANTKEEAENILEGRKMSFCWFPGKLGESGYKIATSLTNFTMKDEREFLSSIGSVPLQAIKPFACWGTVDDCIGQLEQYIRAGAKTLILSNLSSDFDSFFKMSKKLLDYLKSTYEGT
jgi:phthiodiolone/phenolphthiodiolone dimycocerosates ketoreductase